MCPGVKVEVVEVEVEVVLKMEGNQKWPGVIL
jgi:hypothetical protein